MLGIPLGKVAKMPLEEIAIWNRHFTLRPPDAVERLLAQVVIILANAHRKDGSPAVQLHQVAPWLEPPDDRAKREFAEESQYLATALQHHMGEN